MDRVVVVLGLELAVKYLKLGLDLADCRLVQVLQLHELVQLIHYSFLCVSREKLLHRL